MGFGKSPGNLFRWRIRERSSSYDLTRPSGSQTGRFGERPTDSSESTTTVSGVSLWLFMPESAPSGVSMGERLEGDLQGIALPGADVQYGDRLSHGGNKYDVTTEVFGVPNDADPEYMTFALEKVTNP